MVCGVKNRPWVHRRPTVIYKGGVAEASNVPPTTHPANTPLARLKTPRGLWTNMTPTLITAHLKSTVKLLAGTHLGFIYKYISAQSLWAAGSMALLCSVLENDIISLIGCWRSDKMMRYLHVKTEPIVRNYSKLMISNGKYILLPHNKVPIY